MIIGVLAQGCGGLSRSDLSARERLATLEMVLIIGEDLVQGSLKVGSSTSTPSLYCRDIGAGKCGRPCAKTKTPILTVLCQTPRQRTLPPQPCRGIYGWRDAQVIFLCFHHLLLYKRIRRGEIGLFAFSQEESSRTCKTAIALTGVEDVELRRRDHTVGGAVFGSRETSGRQK